jgi:predicted glutamine amidotransferase
VPSLAALFTSDPFLVRCELHRVRDQFSLGDSSDVVGVGAYEDAVVLLKRYGSGVPRTDLWDAPETDVVLIHSQAPTSATPLDENTQPFRLRQWLFAHAGEVDQADRVRERIVKLLPDFLLRAIRGTTVSESIFALYLAQLRELGRMEDANLPAPLAAQLLLKAARMVEQISAEVGGTSKSTLNLAATNGRILVAARLGAEPIHYKLLEGEAVCERCELTADGRDSEPLVRDHRRRRSVVLATRPTNSGWLEVEDGHALAIDRKLSIQVLRD